MGVGERERETEWGRGREGGREGEALHHQRRAKEGLKLTNHEITT